MKRRKGKERKSVLNYKWGWQRKCDWKMKVREWSALSSALQKLRLENGLWDRLLIFIYLWAVINMSVNWKQLSYKTSIITSKTIESCWITTGGTIKSTYTFSLTAATENTEHILNYFYITYRPGYFILFHSLLHRQCSTMRIKLKQYIFNWREWGR